MVPTGWVQTQPLYPTVYSFTTSSGMNLAALVFGDHASPALNPIAVIDNGQPGYAETGTWNTVLGGFNGTNRVATTHRGSVTATASWTFTGLPNASYLVYITYAGKSGYATNAPFTVYDGGTSLGTQLINESILVTQAQGGRAGGSYGGVGWLELGSYAVTSGTLKVLLSNTGNNNFVDADGVLLVPVGGPGVILGNNAITSSNSGLSVGTLEGIGTTGASVSSTTGGNSPTTSATGHLVGHREPARRVKRGLRHQSAGPDRHIRPKPSRPRARIPHRRRRDCKQ